MKNFKIFIEAKIFAIKRRLNILLFNNFDPYPKIYKNFKLNPSMIVENYYNNIEPKLKIENYVNHLDWKIKSRKKLIELLKIKNNLYCKEIYNKKIKIKNGLSRLRIYLEFAENRHAPIDVITKLNIDKYKGIILCMQGDNSGAHLSIGEKLMPADVYKLNNGSDIAIQAADLGFIAVSFERIGFGERRVQNLSKANSSATIDVSLHLLMNGKTLLGETVNEICILSKWLIKKYKNKNLWLKGYSAAGTAAIAAAAVDKNNIKGIAVGGCLGPIGETLIKRGASGFNNIPNMLEWFDMDTLIALISPRPCLIVAGKKDHIYPYYLSKKVIEKAKIVFKKDKAENNLILIEGPRNHTYYPKLLWPTIMKFFK
tara:strand:- start:7784 stop:8896 length:1113 start_codon:yes stop_codon:yes gene_type:complete